ncbi:MAG: alpha/beta fold hydrolase [Saprospiraceae bacterium]
MTVKMEKRKIGNLITEGIPEIPPIVQLKLQEYHNTREAFFLDWLLEDQGLLIATRFGDAAQIHLVEKAKGNRQQVTFFSEPIVNASVRPLISKRQFVFSKDQGGDETFQLYLFDLDTNEYKLLTDGESKNDYPLWSNRGDRLVFTSTAKNGMDMIPTLCIPEQPEHNITLFEKEGFWYPLDWSKDDRYLAFIQHISIEDSQLFIFDCLEQKLVPVYPGKGKISCRNAVWSRKKDCLFYTCNASSQFLQLHYLDIQTGEKKLLFPDLQWDIEGMSLSKDGKSLAFTVNENGYCCLYIMNTDDFSLRRIEGIPEGQISTLKWHPNAPKLAFSFNTAIAPSDVFVWHTEKEVLERWTYSETGTLSPDKLIAPQLISYPTFDSVDNEPRCISAFYYKPVSTQKKSAVLVYIHGGPESQFRPFFSPIFQYYLKELGLAILAPNVRGSSGYGKAFLALDNGYKREDSVYDIGKLLDWIKEQPELDHDRIAVMGGSYGGYMVLASMAHFNDRLRCGIDIVGISNFITFLKNTKSYRRRLRRVEYGDERDPEMRRHLENISPTTNAHKINKPILIVQGLNDPRVPASEAEQMLQAIRDNGGEAWYLLAEDEGHGFRKKRNRDYFTQAVILFLQRYLLDE